MNSSDMKFNRTRLTQMTRISADSLKVIECIGLLRHNDQLAMINEQLKSIAHSVKISY